MLDHVFTDAIGALPRGVRKRAARTAGIRRTVPDGLPARRHAVGDHLRPARRRAAPTGAGRHHPRLADVVADVLSQLVHRRAVRRAAPHRDRDRAAHPAAGRAARPAGQVLDALPEASPPIGTESLVAVGPHRRDHLTGRRSTIPSTPSRCPTRASTSSTRKRSPTAPASTSTSRRWADGSARRSSGSAICSYQYRPPDIEPDDRLTLTRARDAPAADRRRAGSRFSALAHERLDHVGRLEHARLPRGDVVEAVGHGVVARVGDHLLRAPHRER